MYFRVNTMLDSSVRSGIWNDYELEMIICYFKAPTVGIKLMLKQIYFFTQNIKG